MKTIVAEARDSLRINKDTRLDLVDTITAMWNSVDCGQDSKEVAEYWHNKREHFGYPDDGSSEERIQNLELHS